MPLNITRKNITRKDNKRKNITRKQRTYNNNDYNSNEGMLTSVWGPALWHYLHTMSFNYPINPTKEDKKNYRDFIINLQFVLPCKYCRINLKNNFKKKPLLFCYMKNRYTFSKYIYELHELVNKMLSKKSKLSYCDVRDRYEHFRSRCTIEKPKIFKFNSEKTKTIKKTKKEKGCIEPLYGLKSKCIINIVPKEDRHATFQMSKKCIKKK